MKEIGKINNRHKTQCTEGINFYRQEQKAKEKKKKDKPPWLNVNYFKYFSCALHQIILNRIAFICVYGIEIAL